MRNEFCDICGKLTEMVYEYRRDEMVHGFEMKFCYECGYALKKHIRGLRKKAKVEVEK